MGLAEKATSRFPNEMANSEEFSRFRGLCLGTILEGNLLSKMELPLGYDSKGQPQVRELGFNVPKP